MDDAGLRAVSLRDRLRADTRDAHEALDAAFAGLDLGQPRDLGLFLATQHAALSTLDCASDDDNPDRAEARAMAAPMLAALTEDLAALGRPVPRPPVPALRVDATALLYMLLGSRLGTQVMARHWRDAATGAAREAGRYLTLDPRREAWRDFVTRTGAVPGRGGKADATVDAARAIFAHYAAILEAVHAGTAPATEVANAGS